MLNSKNLLGALVQAGLSRSSGRRVEHAMGPQGVGGPGGLLGQLLGGGPVGGSRGTGGGIGDLLSGLSGSLSSGGQAGKGVNPLAIGGMGALAGAVLGRGRSSVGNAIGGGALALLGSLAWQALQKANEQKAGQAAPAAAAPTPAAPEIPLGLRPPETPEEESLLDRHATLLLRAMINAAKADGQIDGSEMQKIIGRIEEAGADSEARDFVWQELKKPLDLEGMVQGVSDQALAAEVYAASLIAIEVDTSAERDYLQRLAAALRLDRGVVQQLHQALNVPA
jgi:uncharacterized membrane protein YebE (DUF533 family)